MYNMYCRINHKRSRIWNYNLAYLNFESNHYDVTFTSNHFLTLYERSSFKIVRAHRDLSVTKHVRYTWIQRRYHRKFTRGYISACEHVKSAQSQDRPVRPILLAFADKNTGGTVASVWPLANVCYNQCLILTLKYSTLYPQTRMRLVMLSVVAVCLCVLVCLVRALISESFDLETFFWPAGTSSLTHSYLCIILFCLLYVLILCIVYLCVLCTLRSILWLLYCNKRVCQCHHLKFKVTSAKGSIRAITINTHICRFAGKVIVKSICTAPYYNELHL